MTPYEFVAKHFELPFELYRFQQEAVNELAQLERVGYYLDVGCVDADTEYLSPTGWRRIDEYDRGPVGQYNLDGTVEMVEPTAYVKKPCSLMLHLKTKYGIDQMLSPEHRVLFKSHVSSKLHVISAEELANRHWASPQGFRGKFITTFTPIGKPGYHLSDEDLRVQVAVIADGYFQSATTKRVVVNLKKERKKERLVKLLTEAGIPFTSNDRATSPGYTYFTFTAPERLKSFDVGFYDCTPAQLKVIADEVMHWDGCLKRGAEFSTVDKPSADFVQYALAASGTQATLNRFVRDRRAEGRGACVEFSVRAYTTNAYSCINAKSTTAHENIKAVPSTDGYKYCFMVPSTFLILRRNGRIFATGNTGKTITSIVSSLFKLKTGQADRVICLMPPILLTNWSRNLAKIPGITHTVYRGPPAARKKLDLDVEFILMSYQIFKLDWDRLHGLMLNDAVVVLCDEAQAIKNVASATHKKVRDFAVSNQLMLLTGTPLSVPLDGYAYIKLVAPGVYRNLHQFEQIHVAKRDFFNKPVEWANLPLLKENLLINSVRVLKEDVLKDLPPVTYTEVFYDLDPGHSALYKELANNQLKVLDDGSKIDITQAAKLFNALQQIPANAEHFSGGTLTSTIYDLVDELMDELGTGKLVVFSKYKLTNRQMIDRFQKYDVRALYGDIPQPQQQRNLDHFISEPGCRMLVLQYASGGAGIDGLQNVCRDILCIELPPTAAAFTQAIARVHRSGQKDGVNVRISIADKTIQHYLWETVQDRDTVVNMCIRGPQDLRDVVNGVFITKKNQVVPA